MNLVVSQMPVYPTMRIARKIREKPKNRARFSVLTTSLNKPEAGRYNHDERRVATRIVINPKTTRTKPLIALVTMEMTRIARIARSTKFTGSLQLPAGQDPERLNVFGARCPDDVVGKLRRGRLFVPADPFEIVAYELFVE